MRGGRIFVRGNAGYRTGIHMKEYKDKKPVIIVGGHAGSFLGEYLAGGIIVVLGIGAWNAPRGAGNDPVGNFTGTGMHGGKIFIRTDKELVALPAQVTAEKAGKDDLREIEPVVSEFANYFGMDAQSLLNDHFFLLKPNAKNPYKQHYTAH
jgi:glutamate synthase domain-containing protein 3